MESVGEFFKQVRETKGLTIDEVASKTRIRTDFLKALEDGNFAILPDQVFAKGFVRTYARSLGLDEEDAMHRFTQSAGAFYDKQEERERLRLRQAEDERRRKANRKTLVLALGVALLVMILLLSREQSTLLFSKGTSAPPPIVATTPAPDTTVALENAREEVKEGAMSQPTPDIPPLVETSEAPDNQGESAEVSTSEELAAPASIPSTSLSEVVLGQPLVLDLEALELTWVVVQIDGGSPHEALLRAGERVTWQGSEQFTLTLGNAGGVKVELNGEPKGPFGPSGSVAREIVLKP
jgi:cytoskeletal protein RodZ